MNLIIKYFPKLSERQKEQFAALPELYGDWNSKINVISRKDMDNFMESLLRQIIWLGVRFLF